MGKSKTSSNSNSKTVPVQLDSEGKIRYDALLKQGSNKDKLIYHKLSDLLPSEVLNEDDPTLQKPDEEEINAVTEATRQALEKLTQ